MNGFLEQLRTRHPVARYFLLAGLAPQLLWDLFVVPWMEER
jgi:hypothetical protein